MKLYRASALLTSLLLFSGILVVVFLFYQDILYRDHYSQNSYHQYLNQKFQLLTEFKKSLSELNNECHKQQRENIIEKSGDVKYQYSCILKSIFIQPKPTKDKYIQVDNILDWLDLERYQSSLHYASSLDELPNSSESEPQIVIMTNDIDERLNQDFYGIIITDHYFDIKGKKIYGVLYSSYDNFREERNLSYKSSVVNTIEEQFSYWQYLPYSRNLLAND
ncbi:DUF2572 family protein [Ursidibacter maritimus]|nr:DUF2572 family protein [Ursidibacter maritimus]KAE9542185.1 hypothetical protein A1D26_08405 [Ursidibacter maritimus]